MPDLELRFLTFHVLHSFSGLVIRRFPPGPQELAATCHGLLVGGDVLTFGLDLLNLHPEERGGCCLAGWTLGAPHPSVGKASPCSDLQHPGQGPL